MNNNYDKIDSVVGAPAYTSTTRPSGGNLYTGMFIYETDTKRVMLYNGTSWVSVTPQKFVPTADTSLPNATLINVSGMAISLEANSVYEIQFFGNAYGNGGDIQLAWTMPGGAIGAPLDRMAIGPTDVPGSYTSRSQTEARFSSHGFATGVGYQLGPASLGSIIEEHLFVSTSTAGTAQLQAAQLQNSGTASVLAGNSWAHVWKRE